MVGSSGIFLKAYLRGVNDFVVRNEFGQPVIYYIVEGFTKARVYCKTPITIGVVGVPRLVEVIDDTGFPQRRVMMIIKDAIE